MSDENEDTGSATAESVLDPAVVASLKELGGEDDPDLFKDLVDTFLEDTPPRISAIDKAARKQNAEALMQAAHGLKSSSANMGATRMSDLCRQLEEAGRNDQLDDVEALAEELSKEFVTVREAMSQA